VGVELAYTGGDPLSFDFKVNAVGENGWTCSVDIPNMNRVGASTSGYTFTGC
jgi:hypothetical protein